MQDLSSTKDDRFTLYMSHRPFHSKKNYDEAEMLNSRFARIEKALIDNQVNLNLWGHVHRYERLVGIYQHKELVDHNMASLIVGTGGNKEGLGAHQEEVPVLKDHIDEPTKKAVCFVEKGFTKMFVYDDRLVAKFFSVEANRVKDILVMYHYLKKNTFPAYLWVFIGLLILFALFVLIYLIKMYIDKIRTRKKDNQVEEKLIIVHE